MDVSGGGRSPFSPRVRSLGGTNSARRNLPLSVAKKNLSSKMNALPRGDVILKTQTNCIESYGLPLPVLVTETLSFANTKDVSVRMSPNGWCWLVYARKLLVWPYRDGKTSSCRELTLPQTDLAHKADLVCVYYDEDSQMPSCSAASPEGVVRYWPSVAHESGYADEAADLQGQECETLADAGSGALVLATSTCTLVLLQCRQTDGRPTVTMRTLRAPGGWLGGLGRRVSLLIFGSMPAQMVETKLVGVCVLEELSLQAEDGSPESAGPHVCCVAAGPALQLWALGGGERLARQLDLRRPLRDVYCRHQLAPPGDINTLEVYVLDMQPANNGLLLLTAAVNPTRSPEMRYALVHVTLEESPRSRVTSMVGLPRLAFQRDDGDAEPPPLGLLECGGRIHLFTRRQLAIISSAADKPDYVDFGSESDCILGTALCHGTPLFFTKKNGVVAVLPNEVAGDDASICESPLGSPCPSDMYDGHLSLYEIDPDEISQVTSDASGKLKTAFLYHVRRDAVSCRNIIDGLFPSQPQSSRRNMSMNVSGNVSLNMSSNMSDDNEDVDVDAALDRTVVKIAKEMLDDVPAGDPRWNASTIGDGVNIPLGSSSALRILTQLRDKQKALSLFIDFLRATGLWQRLGYISRDLALLPTSSVEATVSTRSFVGQLTERLAAATALRRMQQGAFAHVIDTALHQVIDAEQAEGEAEKAISRSLSASDLFYKNVCAVERCAHAVVRWCEEQVGSDGLSRLVLAANKVLLGFLQEVHKCRAANQAALELNQLSSANPADAVTWTNALGGKSLLAVLAKQQKLTVVHAARTVQDATVKGQLYDQAVSLAECLLSDCAYQARSPATQRAYRTLCRDTTKHLIEDSQYERATIIAEKFKDLELLIKMCVDTEDMEKLYQYMDKYASEGFIEQTFAHLTESGSGGASRMLRCLGARYSSRLRAWLSAAPQRHSLLWLQETRAENWHNAAAVLAQLADSEAESRQRAAVIASLAKLTALVSSSELQESLMPRISQKLQLIEQHKALPRQLPAAHDNKLYTPAQLIQMYTSERSRLTEYDYKKALDLADMIADQSERDAMRMKIWCAAILQDNWSDYSADDPLEDIKEKTFFKLIDLIELLGSDDQAPPPLSRLLISEQLGGLSSHTGLQFQLRYGYEHLQSRLPV